MGECLDVIFGKELLLPSNIGHKSSTNDEYGFLYAVNTVLMLRALNVEYLSIDTELGHRVNNAKERRNGFGFLSYFRFVDLQLQLVMLEVLFDLLSIDIIDILVRHS